MKSIWSKLYDDAKDRRYAVLFVLAPLVIFIGLSILVGIAENIAEDLRVAEHITEGGLLCAGGLVVGWTLVWLVVAIRRSRKRQGEQWERHELSCDERRVARSKLKSGTNNCKSVKPVSRPLDLDLKM